MLSYTLASIPLLVIFLWLYTAQMSISGFPIIRKKRICLLIAHPDDEAMFFSPTVTALAKADLGNHLKILCLSTGNADGLGETRKQELVKSARILGLRSDDDVLVLDDPNFPDSMTANWSPSHISALLFRTFAPTHAKTPSKTAPSASIDVLITFDRHGVSAHPNHTSLYHGSLAFLKTLMSRHTGWACPVKFYTLTSINVLRKYASVLDAPASILSVVFLAGKRDAGETPSPLLLVAGWKDYFKGRRAMTAAHRSQMRWFRWGWIAAGRYMVINDLRREKGF